MRIISYIYINLTYQCILGLVCAVDGIKLLIGKVLGTQFALSISEVGYAHVIIQSLHDIAITLQLSVLALETRILGISGLLRGSQNEVVFARMVTTEVITGNTLSRNMDIQGIDEAAGVCLGAVTFAAIFAWFFDARGRVRQIFSICYTFINSLIDQIVDGLFYDNELSDWSNEI
ncbi:hypothetical protein LguiA_013569 [Lonicera macranthoides]